MYQIISDGSCDLDTTIIKEAGIQVVPFYVSVDGKTHQKEMEEIGVREFYQFMIDHPKIFPKTSMPSIQDYLTVFEPLVKAGTDIICICITTKFSGSYNSAMNAKEMLLEEYPDANITVIDATVNTVLQGILVLEAVKMKEAGYSYEKAIATIEHIKSTGRIFFTIGSMDYLVHGGRVGKLAGVAAGTLGLKPLIILEDGEINKGGIARGRNISKKKVMEMVLKHFESNQLDPNTYVITVGYGYDKEEGLAFREVLLEALQQKYPEYHGDISIHQIGATIGVHTGPYPIGVGILRKFDK